MFPVLNLANTAILTNVGTLPEQSNPGDGGPLPEEARHIDSNQPMLLLF
jgi:hypothetical protein